MKHLFEALDRFPYRVRLSQVSDATDGELVWSAIAMAWESVNLSEPPDKIDRALSLATAGQAALLPVLWLDSEVCDGGFHQLFFNPPGLLAPEAEAGFLRLGAPLLAEIVAEACDALTVGVFPRHHHARLLALGERSAAEWSAIFRPLEERYRDNAGLALERRCADYIRAHPGEFFVGEG